MPNDLREQLAKYLADAHSIEQQALAQMRSAPDIAGAPALRKIFEQHLAETEEHERLVRERLEALGGSPSRTKDIAGAVTGKGFVLFARSQPDTPGKLVAHAYSYEHLELAAYELVAHVADRAGDAETAAVARRIRDQEEAMSERLARSFDTATEASLRELSPDDLREQLVTYLQDAHALEMQAIQLLERGPKIAGEPSLAAVLAAHLDETRSHERLVEELLRSADADPSGLKDAALRAGALAWGAFFQAQPDTPGKLAAFAYAFEHLEIGGYEQLRRVAERVGDRDAIRSADAILLQEVAAAARVQATFERAADASLAAQGVAV
jgi:ferritin-like metal-binding protein YciE